MLRYLKRYSAPGHGRESVRALESVQQAARAQSQAVRRYDFLRRVRAGYGKEPSSCSQSKHDAGAFAYEFSATFARYPSKR